MNQNTWIKEKREEYGISQNRLAIEIGVTRQYVSQLEKGERNLTPKIEKKLKKAFDRLNPEAELELIIDYVRFRFPTQDEEHIIKKLLRLKVEYMAHEAYGFYGYEEHYRLGDIYIMVSRKDEQRGVLIELKGKGCRQFECYLRAQERSWFDFFRDAFTLEGVPKRIDLAINDKVGILNIPELAQKCRNQECVSVFRTFRNYESGELVHTLFRGEKPFMGNTLYIGSMKSDIYFCIYVRP